MSYGLRQKLNESTRYLGNSICDGLGDLLTSNVDKKTFAMYTAIAGIAASTAGCLPTQTITVRFEDLRSEFFALEKSLENEEWMKFDYDNMTLTISQANQQRRYKVNPQDRIQWNAEEGIARIIKEDGTSTLVYGMGNSDNEDSPSKTVYAAVLPSRNLQEARMKSENIAQRAHAASIEQRVRLSRR